MDICTLLNLQLSPISLTKITKRGDIRGQDFLFNNSTWTFLCFYKVNKVRDAHRLCNVWSTFLFIWKYSSHSFVPTTLMWKSRKWRILPKYSRAIISKQLESNSLKLFYVMIFFKYKGLIFICILNVHLRSTCNLSSY